MASVITQLQAKLSLEATFTRDIRTIFTAILRDFAVKVAASGVPPEAGGYSPAWTAALDKHYRRVQRKFSGIAKKGEKQQETDDTDKEALLALALLTWRNNTLPTHAAHLTHTTRTNMSESIRIAGEQFAAENTIPSDRELAAAAMAILRRKFHGRQTSIAISETQAASESTKFIEAEVETGLKPRVLGGGAVATTTRQGWRTVGDSKVRQIHRRVNGQRRALTAPFLVNGEYLMYPGDGSLGASAGNVANCRCISQYDF